MAAVSRINAKFKANCSSAFGFRLSAWGEGNDADRRVKAEEWQTLNLKCPVIVPVPGPAGNSRLGRNCRKSDDHDQHCRKKFRRTQGL